MNAYKGNLWCFTLENQVEYLVSRKSDVKSTYQDQKSENSLDWFLINQQVLHEVNLAQFKIVASFSFQEYELMPRNLTKLIQICQQKLNIYL